MAYVVSKGLGGTRKECIGICATVQEARKLSMRYIGKSRSKDTYISKFSKELILNAGISKGKVFDFGFGDNKYEQMFIPKSPDIYIVIMGTYPYNEYFVNSKGEINGRATDKAGRPYYVLSKSQF